MIINYFFLAFVTIINFVFLPADISNPITIRIIIICAQVAGLCTGTPMKSIEIVGAT